MILGNLKKPKQTKTGPGPEALQSYNGISILLGVMAIFYLLSYRAMPFLKDGFNLIS